MFFYFLVQFCSSFTLLYIFIRFVVVVACLVHSIVLNRMLCPAYTIQFHVQINWFDLIWFRFLYYFIVVAVVGHCLQVVRRRLLLLPFQSVYKILQMVQTNKQSNNALHMDIGLGLWTATTTHDNAKVQLPFKRYFPFFFSPIFLEMKYWIYSFSLLYFLFCFALSLVTNFFPTAIFHFNKSYFL